MEDIVKATVLGTSIEEYINHGRPARCKYCNAKIWFVRGDTGKQIPISEEAAGEGDTYFVKHFDNCSGR